MIKIEYGSKYTNRPVAVALGFFDSIHKGHKALFDSVKEAAKKYNCLSAVMTFKNNPYDILGGGIKLVYNYSERTALLEKLGIEAVICALFDERFKNTSAYDFLNVLTNNISIKYIVCGYDFKYGKYREGNANTLKQYCAEKGITVDIAEETKLNGIRISSTAVRESLEKGDIVSANSMLTFPYFIMGNVLRGRNIGSKLLYPTINIGADKDKLQLPEGVYATITEIEGVKYPSVTNCGAKPTFGEAAYGIETHIIGFEADMYGKTVTINFLKKLREIKKFENAESLKAQICSDIKQATDIAKAEKYIV
jgi:riboflavin kinase/FMN adenylyltransferase